MLRNTNASLANLPAVTGSDLRNFDLLSCDLFLRRSLVNCQKRLKKNKSWRESSSDNEGAHGLSHTPLHPQVSDVTTSRLNKSQVQVQTQKVLKLSWKVCLAGFLF